MPDLVDKADVKYICVDDFALRKRFSYGTVMVDLETHRIIDLIPSRDTNTVKEWLRSYPNLEIISRDGAMIYSSASTNSHPSALQVSDRFHLIKGLSEVITKYLIREFPARIEIPLTRIQSEDTQNLYDQSNRTQRIKFAHQKRKEGLSVSDIALLLHSSPTTISKYLAIPEDTLTNESKILRERQHLLATEQKQKEIDEARKLASEGYPIEQIATMMGHTYRTIQRYLDPNYSTINGHYNVRIPGKLAPYEKEVKDLRNKGMTYVKIHKILADKGYTGSVASLRMFMQKERTRTYYQDAYSQTTEFVPRKTLCQLVYKKLEDIATITDPQYKQVLIKYPILGKLYKLVKEFYRALFSKKPELLDCWINVAKEFNILELQTFLNGLIKDIDAIKNSIIYPYSNGLAEGSVNKIKVIKRIMYGRNSFELLKAKILLHELMHCKIN